MVRARLCPPQLSLFALEFSRLLWASVKYPSGTRPLDGVVSALRASIVSALRASVRRIYPASRSNYLGPCEPL